MNLFLRISALALVVVLTGCGSKSADGKNSLVRMTQIQDPLCQFGATQIATGLDANGNGTLEDGEVINTSLICTAQGGVSNEEFSLSAKGEIAGNLDLALIPTARTNGDVSVQSRSLSSIVADARKVTSQTGKLWLTPSNIASAIKADQNALENAKNNLGSSTQITPPIIEPFEVPVGIDGSYSIFVPAGTGYSLSYVSADGTQAVKFEGINVSPNQKTDASVAEVDLEAAGSLKFVVQNAANNNAIENAAITLLSDGTTNISDATGAVAFEGLAAGSYLLLVANTGFVSQALSVDITSGQTLDLGVVPLSNLSGSASGTVTVDSTLLTSLDNIVVYARDSGGGIYSTLTDASGGFSFAALPVNMGYSFIAQANDFSAKKIDNVAISAGNNSAIGSIELLPSSAFVGAITGFAKFSDKSTILNAHAGLLVAIEGTDKEAVTSRDGAFILNGLAPGRYTLNFTDSNYQTTTLENVRVVATATTSLEPVNLKLKTGQLSGVVSLDGQLSSAGILVEILGTTAKAHTDNSGRWFLNLPTGNYGNGIRYSANLFESKTVSETISVIENGEYQATAQLLAQTGKRLSLNVSANGGSCSVLQVALQGTSGEASGYSALFSVEDGKVEQDLVFGDYNLTTTCVDDGFESVVKTISIVAGNGLIETLDPISLRVSFVTINGGATYTNDANVNLNIGAVGASEMQITQGLTTSGWVTIADTHALALEAGDGDKTVIINLRDAAQQPLSDVSASINLDTTINIASFTATGATTKNDVLHLRLDLSGETAATATASIPGLVSGLVLFDNGLNGDVSANDGIYERNLDITTPNEITAAVTANITDRAGNTASQAAAAGIVLSTSPSISAVSVSSNVASGEMTIRFSTDEPATSAINYGADQAALNTNLPVEALLTQNHTITLSGLPANQLTYFQLVATDAATNVGNFNGQGKLAPAPIDDVNAAAGSSEVGLIWGKSTHNELAGYNIYRSADGGSSFSLLNTSGVVVERYLVDSNAVNDTVYKYYITVVDVDGNESISSASVEVTPKLNLAGPTEMSGGVITTNTMWLSSRSPYNISDNMLIRTEGSLLLMAGTQVQFVGAAKHILVKGSIQAYGTAENKVTVAGDAGFIGVETNYSKVLYDSAQNTTWRHVNWDYVGSTYNEGSASGQLQVHFENSRIMLSNHLNMYYIDSVVDSAIIYNGNCDAGSYYQLSNIDNLVNTQLSLSASATAGNSCANAGDLSTGYSGLRVYEIGNMHEVIANNVELVRVINSITNSQLTHSRLYSTNGVLSITGSEFSGSSLTGSTTAQLTMMRNKVDTTTRITGGNLNIGGNYWGTTDISVIGEMTGYISDQAKNTHLYPIITSADLENADWDSDGIPDINDHDNDNDGYSDLQEDWASDPAYGSIYSPLDANSYPSGAIDTDMDGIADVTDNDDDNDNLSDADEAIYGTNPLLADTDNDGSLDGDEISRKYDPLNRANFPYIGIINGITIDGSNVNADGWVYFEGDTVTLNDVTVSPGVKLMVDGSTALTFNNSSVVANQNNPIFIRSTGSGSAVVTFNGTQVSYANIILNMPITTDSNTIITRSDLSLLNGTFDGITQDCLIRATSASSFVLNGKILHSNVIGTVLYLTGEMHNSRHSGGYIYGQGGLLNQSVVSTLNGDGKTILNSIVNVGSFVGEFKNSDVTMPSSEVSMSAFFDSTYIESSDGSAFFDGLGTPIDTIGDGLAETVFTLGGQTYTVDGIKNPRSTPNYPNGESDLWDPNGVGVLWDKNNPDTFPNPLTP